MNLAKAHAKARQAMKRREEEIEQSELEGGEINLIPYLDIVTNLMLFILASISTGLILGQLNTTIPDSSKQPPPSAGAQPDTPPEERSLDLVVQIASDFVRVYTTNPAFESIVASPQAPRKFKRTPATKDASGNIDATWAFEYRALNDFLYNLAKQWSNKQRAFATYKVVLQVDKDAPYGTLIAIMDTLRCKLPPPGKESEAPCLLPRIGQGADGNPEIDPATKKPILIGPDGKRITAPYNPDTMALFHDIIFSPGFK
jgi:biopolymer transport protein TolR